MSTHEHKWELRMHIDGCHYYASGYECKCGATRASRGERDVKNDPYSTVWMADTADDCARCAELLKGATPLYSDEIELPKGAA